MIIFEAIRRSSEFLRNIMKIKNTRKSPQEIIENMNRPQLGEAWVKRPGKGLESISVARARGYVKTLSTLDEPYTQVISQPSTNPLQKYPSGISLGNFIDSHNMRALVIAQTSPLNGSLKGYYVVRKTKDTPKSTPFSKIIDFFELALQMSTLGYFPGKGLLCDLTRACQNCTKHTIEKKYTSFFTKYHIQHKYIPAQR